MMERVFPNTGAGRQTSLQPNGSSALRFPNASFLEHLGARRIGTDTFIQGDLGSVRWWWEDCLSLHGGLPSSGRVDPLLSEPGLRDRLLLIEDIYGDPRCVYSGDEVETMTGQTLTGVRLSRFGTPETDRLMLRSVYAEAGQAGRAIGLRGHFRINTAPAGAFVQGHFPVRSPLGRSVGILTALTPIAYRPPGAGESEA